MMKSSTFLAGNALLAGAVSAALLGCSRSEVSTNLYIDGGDPLGLSEAGTEQPEPTETDEPTPPVVPTPGSTPSPDPTPPPTNPMPTGAPQTCDTVAAGVCAGLGPGSSRCDGNRIVYCEVDDAGCSYEAASEFSAACAQVTGTEADCSDGEDDDGDGFADCSDVDCMGLAVCEDEVCDNGIDDDEDGDVDCEDDECTATSECSMCGADIYLGSALGQVASGSSVGAGNDTVASCAAGSESADVVFSWQAPSSGCFVADTFGSGFDTSLHLHGTCPDFDEYVCVDDSGDGVQSEVVFLADETEELLIVVDGFGEGEEGNYVLHINQCVELCTDFDDNDLDGLFDCEDPDCQNDGACVEEICDNGADDDGDGLVDCADGECGLMSECQEDCGDGVDNDLDGAVDCEDSSCMSEVACSCQNAITLGSTATGRVSSGTTVGGVSNVSASCGGGANSADVIFTWTAPASGCYDLDTFGSDFDTALHVHSDCPEFEELACSDDAPNPPSDPGGDGTQSAVRLLVEAGLPYVIAVDGYGEASTGNFVLNLNTCVENCINGTDDDLDMLADCDDPDCATFEECIVEVCDNGVDDDGDGDLDCLDSECTLEPICDEVCDDEIDNDADTLVDCDDPECSEAVGCFECPTGDIALGAVTGTPVTSYSTTGAGADISASCGGGSLSEEILFVWTAPSSECYRFDTTGSDYDTTLHVHSLCPYFEELACDDDDGPGRTSSLELDVTEGEDYLVAVDGFGETNSGYFQLNIELCP